jgi:hypothetical protein
MVSALCQRLKYSSVAVLTCVVGGKVVHWYLAGLVGKIYILIYKLPIRQSNLVTRFNCVQTSPNI